MINTILCDCALTHIGLCNVLFRDILKAYRTAHSAIFGYTLLVALLIARADDFYVYQLNSTTKQATYACEWGGAMIFPILSDDHMSCNGNKSNNWSEKNDTMRRTWIALNTAYANPVFIHKVFYLIERCLVRIWKSRDIRKRANSHCCSRAECVMYKLGSATWGKRCENSRTKYWFQIYLLYTCYLIVILNA